MEEDKRFRWSGDFEADYTKKDGKSLVKGLGNGKKNSRKKKGKLGSRGKCALMTKYKKKTWGMEGEKERVLKEKEEGIPIKTDEIDARESLVYKLDYNLFGKIQKGAWPYLGMSSSSCRMAPSISRFWSS